MNIVLVMLQKLSRGFLKPHKNSAYDFETSDSSLLVRFQKASEAFQKQGFCAAGMAGHDIGLDIFGVSRAGAEVG